MDFRTEIQLIPFDFTLSHRDKIMMMGSCFTESISEKLQSEGFSPDVNPFGIVYNPSSLASGLRGLLQKKLYLASDLVEHQGMYHSFDHHGRFSSPEPKTCLEEINRRIKFSSARLREASLLILTFGTAYVYRLKSSGSVVTNCHQLPDNLFDRTRLPIDEIVNEWDDLLQKLKDLHPNLRVLFTVSPIRHWKDGAHRNQLSKSTLLLAVDELINRNDHCHYFPSYELLLDDLRDYRFYADDMNHPSPAAIDYIWKKFSNSFFNEQTKCLSAEWQDIQHALNHRPFNAESHEYRSFLKKIHVRLQSFREKNPEVGG